MRVRVRLFARARDLAGTDLMELTLPEGATAGQLRRALAERAPALAGLLGRSALAVNDEFADDALPLPAGAEVAVLPPVSGGGAAAVAGHPV
jgi:molybdopterin converting factor subunit 1